MEYVDRYCEANGLRIVGLPGTPPKAQRSTSEAAADACGSFMAGATSTTTMGLIDPGANALGHHPFDVEPGWRSAGGWTAFTVQLAFGICSALRAATAPRAVKDAAECVTENLADDVADDLARTATNEASESLSGLRREPGKLLAGEQYTDLVGDLGGGTENFVARVFGHSPRSFEIVWVDTRGLIAGLRRLRQENPVELTGKITDQLGDMLKTNQLTSERIEPILNRIFGGVWDVTITGNYFRAIRR
jgi:hypothetical protein